jgi:hypothetical protein
MGYNYWDGEAEVTTISRGRDDGIESKSRANFKGNSRLDKELSAEMGSHIAEGHAVAHVDYLSKIGSYNTHDSGSGIGDAIQTGSALIGIAKCLLPFL